MAMPATKLEVPEGWADLTEALESKVATVPRLAAVSVFDGSGNLSGALQRARGKAVGYDIVHDAVGQDITCEEGEMVLVGLIMQLYRGGLLFLAPLAKTSCGCQAPNAGDPHHLPWELGGVTPAHTISMGW